MKGFLILTLPHKQLSALLPQMVARVCERAHDVLYIHLDLATLDAPAENIADCKWPLRHSSQFIQKLYGSFSATAPSLDTRVIMSGFKGQINLLDNPRLCPANLFVDHFDTKKLEYLKTKYKCQFDTTEPFALFSDDDVHKSCDGIGGVSDGRLDCEDGEKIYQNIVAGGTFDRIHPGHKILLMEGLLRCTNRFTIGVADGVLLSKKILAELIEPVEVRIRNLRNLLEDMDPSVEYCLEPIEDPCGPSGRDPRMEMIIVSQETVKGGNFVNKTRLERNLNELDVVVIDLMEDTNRNECEEQKVSSSSTRMRLLGTCLREPELSGKPEPPPYIIGLTGRSASGKSSIAKTLEGYGAHVVDCDKLGHKAYTKGTACYMKLVEIYGSKILTESHEINRKALGAEVFGDEEKLQQLNLLVWPEILRLLKEEISEQRKKGTKLVAVDAAVLLEANWDQQCHEVWVCVLPTTEAVRRICERDGCSADQAELRLNRQMPDSERVKRAHVVLCSLWDKSYTAQQVATACQRLKLHHISSQL